MRDTTSTKIRILRAQPHGVAEGTGVLHRAQQHGRILYRLLGLRKPDTTGFGQLSHFGELFAFKANGQCAERIDMRLVQ